MALSLLVIVSDIDGEFLPEPPALEDLPEVIEHFHRVIKVDSRTLGGIEYEPDKDKRHRYLVGHGIDLAATRLASEYSAQITMAVGLSIGGVILWRAIERGLKVQSLLCFSSTRLRFEKKAPQSGIKLYFGSNDQNRPDTHWHYSLGMNENVVQGFGHEFYREPIGVDILRDHLKTLA
ncbi:MAG TPA: hypothetical protein VEB86_01805 [Chryseosolibacter sp.]|nr:hypothetical protein [Chryseosolibacter sp.]